MFLLFSITGFVWACIFALRARGRINNKESSSPGLAFCTRFSRQRAGRLAIVALAVGVLSPLGAVIQWRSINSCKGNPKAASSNIFKHRENIRKQAKYLDKESDYLIGDLQNTSEELNKLGDTMGQGLVKEHQEALDKGSREQWCQSIISSGNKRGCEALLGILDRINDLPTRLDLLYCFQQISGIDLGITLHSQLSEKELTSRIAEAKRKWKESGF